ncbi:WD_REPEATS_REGION domain-containing protein [Haematococcus lacustris]|uniref:WD_REPEATS_REGION domain-containing protein n=1 Tax=Haematococcus lacustris TaxID=44745 RepID=A0A699YU49_HAELA|nr:WD_REPEATS_REGION domain-containing protein [Haematococcus lacustris]
MPMSSPLSRCQAVELVARVAVLLLRLHHTQLRSTPSARPSLARIHAALHAAVQGLKDTLGFNVAALQHLQRAMKERSGMTDAAEAASGKLVKRPAGKKQGRGGQEQGKGVKKQKSR